MQLPDVDRGRSVSQKGDTARRLVSLVVGNSYRRLALTQFQHSDPFLSSELNRKKVGPSRRRAQYMPYCLFMPGRYAPGVTVAKYRHGYANQPPVATDTPLCVIRHHGNNL